MSLAVSQACSMCLGNSCGIVRHHTLFLFRKSAAYFTSRFDTNCYSKMFKLARCSQVGFICGNLFLSPSWSKCYSVSQSRKKKSAVAAAVDSASAVFVPVVDSTSWEAVPARLRKIHCNLIMDYPCRLCHG